MRDTIVTVHSSLKQIILIISVKQGKREKIKLIFKNILTKQQGHIIIQIQTKEKKKEKIS